VDQLLSDVTAGTGPLAAAAPANVTSRVAQALPAAVNAATAALNDAAAAAAAATEAARARTVAPVAGTSVNQGQGGAASTLQDLAARLRSGVGRAQAALSQGPLVAIVQALDGAEADVKVGGRNGHIF
jgi:hypothetical protein